MFECDERSKLAILIDFVDNELTMHIGNGINPSQKQIMLACCRVENFIRMSHEQFVELIHQAMAKYGYDDNEVNHEGW